MLRKAWCDRKRALIPVSARRGPRAGPAGDRRPPRPARGPLPPRPPFRPPPPRPPGRPQAARPEPPATGIDYLGLVATAHDDEAGTAAKIDFTALGRLTAGEPGQDQEPGQEEQR